MNCPSLSTTTRTLIAFAFIAGLTQASEAKDGDRIGVIVTGWGTPDGYSESYQADLDRRIMGGEIVTEPGQPCSQWHVGEFPYQMEVGRTPYAFMRPVPGYESLYDGYGVYRRDGDAYVALLDESVRLDADAVDANRITPLGEIESRPGGRPYGPDPRNGVDYMAGLYRIDGANGISDYQELERGYFYRVAGMMGWKMDAKPVYPKFLKKDYGLLKSRLERMFSDEVSIQSGKYARVEGETRYLGDVAVDLAADGVRNLLLVKPITDQNIFANFYLDRAIPLQSLCRNGYDTDDFRIEQIRQLGRTPEYNEMSVRLLKPHFERIDKGEEVTVVYTTYGLPWPGGDPKGGPTSSSQPWIQEEFHENSFLNFLSVKPAIEAAFGNDYALNFSKPGGTGSAASRTNSTFAYGLYSGDNLGYADDPLKFSGLREMLDTLLWEEKRNEVIVFLSHWHNGTRLTTLGMRELNDIPLNTIKEIRKGQVSQTWCERYVGPGKYEQTVADDHRCPDGYARLQVTETFEDFADAYATTFAARVRGGIERYGLMPGLGIEVMATGAISRADGGAVAVALGPLAGAALTVFADPRPGEPETYEWANRYRPPSDADPNTGADAVRTINDYATPSDFLDSAKDDFTAYIGVQTRTARLKPLKAPKGSVSPMVLVGPYRTLFNRPARVTLPFDAEAVGEPARLVPHIYNDLTDAFEPVWPVTGGEGTRIERATGTVSFDVQTLGVFVLVDAEAR